MGNLVGSNEEQPLFPVVSSDGSKDYGELVVVIEGDRSIGKTALIERFFDETFSDYIPYRTTDAEPKTFDFVHNGVRRTGKIRVLDVMNEPKFTYKISARRCRAHGVLVTYLSGSYESLASSQVYFKDFERLRPELPRVLVACKNDLAHHPLYCVFVLKWFGDLPQELVTPIMLKIHFFGQKEGADPKMVQKEDISAVSITCDAPHVYTSSKRAGVREAFDLILQRIINQVDEGKLQIKPAEQVMAENRYR